MTIQERMKVKLQQVDIPAKEIEVYGGQIVVTAYCQKSAEKWVGVLSKFARVRACVQTIDYAKENKQSSLNPSKVIVWRVFAALQQNPASPPPPPRSTLYGAFSKGLER